MTTEIVERVLRSTRYRDVDRAMVARLAADELPRAHSVDDAVKRVKRRLHQAVGAFRGALRRDTLAGVRATWNGDPADPAFRAACSTVLGAHASTRERIEHLASIYPAIWSRTGVVPRRVLDVGCGLHPLSLPWMGLPSDASYTAVDVDHRPLDLAGEFLGLVGQPHRVEVRDIVTDIPAEGADVALLLKLVTTLDRQDPASAARLLQGLDVRHAVVSFPAHGLSGRGHRVERTNRRRLESLVSEAGRVSTVAEASVPNELIFVLTLHG